LFDELQVAHGDGSFAQLAKLDLLVIDDFAISPMGPAERNDLLELLDDRIGTRSTLITSQLPVKAWHTYLNDPTLADAILDRVVHSSHKIELKGTKSLRWFTVHDQTEMPSTITAIRNLLTAVSLAVLLLPLAAPVLRGRSDLPFSARRWLRESNRSRMASAMLASPIHACQCSTGNRLAMIVARVPARSSMTSIRSARVGPSIAASAQSSSNSTSVRATRRQPAREAAVAVQDAQLLGQPWDAQV
jgi:hypothetical protein